MNSFFRFCVLVVPVALLGIAVLSRTTSAEPVEFKYCDENGPSQCEISNMQITPCPEAASNKACKKAKGETGAITFDYVPHWNIGNGKILTRAYCVTLFDVPYVGMDSDACKYTTCPLVKDVANSYNFTMTFSSYPPRLYDIKFKIWEEDAEPEKQCCFIVKIDVVRPQARNVTI